jgi:hypothetical protein
MVVADATRSTNLVACRDGGKWNLRLAWASGIEPSAYAPAGEETPVQLYLHRIRAGPALSEVEEAKALKR